MPSGEHLWRERGLRDAVLDGDEQAWQTLYDESFAPLLAYVLWRCGGLRDAAEEITQETWLIAVRRIRSFAPEHGTFLTWLRGIAANVVRNHLRRVRPPLAARASSCADAAAELERREEAHRLARVLAGLPPDYEEVLRAKYLDELSVEEIALRRGQTCKAIESLLSRARAALRSALPESAQHEEAP